MVKFSYYMKKIKISVLLSFISLFFVIFYLNGQYDTKEISDNVNFNNTKIENILFNKANIEGGIKSLFLDLYKTGKECEYGCPVIIGIHGGGFELGNKKDPNWQKIASDLNKEGYSVILIDYRLVRDKPILSDRTKKLAVDFSYEKNTLDFFERDQIIASLAAVEDVIASFRWLEENYEKYNLDKEDVVLAGSSAGAVTALNTGYYLSIVENDLSIKLKGVINLWGGTYLDGKKFNLPVFIVHGEDDKTAPIKYSRDLYDRLLNNGNYAEAYFVEKAGHGFNSINLYEIEVDGFLLIDHLKKFLENII